MVVVPYKKPHHFSLRHQLSVPSQTCKFCFSMASKFILIAVTLLLASVVLIRSDDDTEAKALTEEIKGNQAASEKLVVSINKFLDNKKNVTTDSVGKDLKDAAGELWNSGDNLSLSLIKLADFLGVQPPPPPTDEDHEHDDNDESRSRRRR